MTTSKTPYVRNRAVHYANERGKRKREQALQQFSNHWIRKRLVKCK